MAKVDQASVLSVNPQCLKSTFKKERSPISDNILVDFTEILKKGTCPIPPPSHSKCQSAVRKGILLKEKCSLPWILFHNHQIPPHIEAKNTSPRAPRAENRQGRYKANLLTLCSNVLWRKDTGKFENEHNEQAIPFLSRQVITFSLKKSNLKIFLKERPNYLKIFFSNMQRFCWKESSHMMV